jgi:hypothetical protein
MVVTLFERFLSLSRLYYPEFFTEYFRQFIGGVAERRQMTARYHTEERIDVC